MVSSASPMNPTRVVNLTPTRGFAASYTPKLHQQLAHTHRDCCPKELFKIVSGVTELLSTLFMTLVSFYTP